jgi:hypothetical protein
MIIHDNICIAFQLLLRVNQPHIHLQFVPYIGVCVRESDCVHLIHMCGRVSVYI